MTKLKFEPGSFAADVEASARRRFVRWDPRLWNEILDTPARYLAEGLVSEGTTVEDAQRCLETYLTLAAEGIGLGYLVPGPTAGVQTLMNVCWVELIPQMLPAVAHPRRAAVLAQLWNLCENAERLPAWWRRLFVGALSRMPSLDDVEQTVQALGHSARQAPTGPKWNPAVSRQRHHWLWLGKQDPQFLPGVVQFLTPTIACIHDRLRDGRDGRPAAAVAVWLAQEPEILGPLHLAAPAAADRPFQITRDERFTGAHFTAQNEYRAVVSVTTSQCILAVYPDESE